MISFVDLFPQRLHLYFDEKDIFGAWLIAQHFSYPIHNRTCCYPARILSPLRQNANQMVLSFIVGIIEFVYYHLGVLPAFSRRMN